MPAAHSWHTLALAAPAAVPYAPAVQFWQHTVPLAQPTAVEYWPAAHGAHVPLELAPPALEGVSLCEPPDGDDYYRLTLPRTPSKSQAPVGPGAAPSPRGRRLGRPRARTSCSPSSTSSARACGPP